MGSGLSRRTLHARHAGHHLIQQHEVVVLLAGHLQRGLAVVGGVVLEVLVVQIQGKRLMDDRVVVADENLGMLVHGGSPLSSIVAGGCDGIVKPG